MPKAWDISTGDPGVIIATVDTGVNPALPDLQGALVPGWDFVNNTYTAQDLSGHGTAVATEIVARGNNGQGIAGLCWRCRLMPIRVSATGEDFDPTKTAWGIKWAVEHGARIISLSFNDEGTFPTADSQVAAAIAYAAQRNVAVFASSGNTGSQVFTHPASDPGAYPVAGTDQNDFLYPWSTRGSWIHLAAPGCHMLIGLDGWGSFCGNSTSAPAVAGIAGLMLSVNPSLTPAQLVSVLVSTSQPVVGIAGGRVDAYRALLAVGGRSPSPPAPPPPPPPPPAAIKRLKPPPSAKMTTRVQHGVLRANRIVKINVQSGRVAATLRSTKASSCSVSLRSSEDIWVSASHDRGSVSLAARVPSGKYSVQVSCRNRRPRPFALVLRALFAS
jgi:subtilisin family serine protease